MAISWSAGCKVWVSSSGPPFGILPHMPDSKPTEKQLESLLKATDRTAVGEDDSIGGRTFIAVRERFHPRVMCKKMTDIEANKKEKFRQVLSGIDSCITRALDGETVSSWLRTKSVRAGGITGYVRMLLTAMPSSSAILGGLCGRSLQLGPRQLSVLEAGMTSNISLNAGRQQRRHECICCSGPWKRMDARGWRKERQ